MGQCAEFQYHFVSIPDLLTAPWVQAWGSILGAALGAGLAVTLAIRFESRKESRSADHYNKTLRLFVRRLLVLARESFLVSLDSGAELRDLDQEIGELRRDAGVFNRMSPFSEAGNPQLAAETIDLTVQLERLLLRIDKFSTWGSLQPQMRTELQNLVAGVTEACDTVLEPISDK